MLFFFFQNNLWFHIGWSIYFLRKTIFLLYNWLITFSCRHLTDIKTLLTQNLLIMQNPDAEHRTCTASLEKHNARYKNKYINSHSAKQNWKNKKNCYRYHSSSQRSLSPFWFQLLTIFSSFIGRDFYHRQLLVFRIVKIKITFVTLITSYTNLATLKLDTHSSVQTLIDFTRTLLTFRFVIASMRSMVFECLDNFLCFSLSSQTSRL